MVQDTKYDLIIDINHKLIRLQVKTARPNIRNTGQSIVFNCRSTTNNVRECKQRYYSTNDVDYFAACLLMPKEQFKVKFKELRMKYNIGDCIIILSDYFKAPLQSVLRRIDEVITNEDFQPCNSEG